MTTPSMTKVVDPRHARNHQYRTVITKIAKHGVCPFCPDTFRYHRKPILQRRGAWLITKNAWPYRSAKHHFILVGKTHKETLQEMTPRDFADILWLVRWAIEKYHIRGGGFALRFGETTYTGATVCHLHAHLIVPKLGKNRRARTVTFPIG